ncbi:MAG: diguanylate cyclase [Armatimonadota bacterium]|nr:diguanylate cyclase [Armatimonadota bacterium]MDR7540551.1 diguanylate cyclase [Armatimonadota bacterium]
MSISTGPRPPRLLVVDDEPAILDLLKRRLEALGCSVTVLPGGSGVLRAVREEPPDLILLDIMMPDVDGFSVCQALKDDPEVRDIPIIMMTARSELDSRIKGLELGAHDYVAKPFETAELIARVRAALRVKHLQDELKEANRKLERLATSDPLTDLPNRRSFDEQFFLAVERSRRSGEPFSIMMVDLDHFKQINDTYGHQVGDDALRVLGRLLNGRRRVTDLVGRYGGEEFVWVLPGARAEDAVEVAEWLRRTVEEMTFEAPQGRVRLTISVGLTTYVPLDHGPFGTTTILEAADQALREAKQGGRNRVVHRELGLEEVAAETASDEEGPEVTRYR